MGDKTIDYWDKNRLKNKEKTLLKAVKIKEDMTDDVKIKDVITALEIQKNDRNDMELQEILDFMKEWRQVTSEIKEKLEKGYILEKESEEMNLENVTVEDCEELYSKKDTITVLNDGKIEKFEKEDK